MLRRQGPVRSGNPQRLDEQIGPIDETGLGMGHPLGTSGRAGGIDNDRDGITVGVLISRCAQRRRFEEGFVSQASRRFYSGQNDPSQRRDGFIRDQGQQGWGSDQDAGGRLRQNIALFRRWIIGK